MEIFLATGAAVLATLLSIELWRSWRSRKRLHAEIWSIAFAAFAVATWALVAGLALGWTSTSFRIFYFFGGIANIPLLAAGSIALASERGGRIAYRIVGVWLVFGFFATFLAPLNGALPTGHIPEGSEVFSFTFAIDALTLPGPRVFAAVSGGVGTIVIIGLSTVTVFRSWTTNRRLAYGNLLIIGGVIAPALGGSLTAIGRSSALALSLAVGIVLLWGGYRMASGAKTVVTNVAEPATP
ncbi:MAG: hypothetical protein ACR2N2_11125 [Acidimicrobiia bacterium]